MPVKAKEETKHTAKAAVARKRIALIIANPNSQERTDHENAAKVGARMEDALQNSWSFDTELVCNASKEDMDAAIGRFITKVKENHPQPCDTLFFFFGRGTEKGGCNCLLEYNEHKEEESSGINLGKDVINALNGPLVRHPDSLNMLMLDASRLEPDGELANGTYRSATNTIDDDEQFRAAHCAVDSSQFLLMFATSPGTKAIPGLLTEEFLKALQPENTQYHYRIDELLVT